MATATNPSTFSAENVKNKTTETASGVTDKAKQAASNLGQRAEDAKQAVGGGIKSLADTIRDKGPQEGMFGTATSSIAEGLESGANYLQEEGFSGIADDLTNLIRRNPIPALIVGVGLGFIVARATMRR